MRWTLQIGSTALTFHNEWSVPSSYHYRGFIYALAANRSKINLVSDGLLKHLAKVD